MTVKTYAAKSSVTRALKAEGKNPELYNIVANPEGKFYAMLKRVDQVAKHERSVQYGAAKPRNGNCFAVWEIADKMEGARRKEVVAACVAKGIPEGTAKTQYQHWFVSKKG